MLCVLTGFLFISRKFEEVNKLGKIFISKEDQNGFREEIKEAERKMLKHLSFKLYRPTVFEFLELYHEAYGGFSMKIQYLSMVSNLYSSVK